MEKKGVIIKPTMINEPRNVKFRDGKIFPRIVKLVEGIPTDFDIIGKDYLALSKEADKLETISVEEFVK